MSAVETDLSHIPSRHYSARRFVSGRLRLEADAQRLLRCSTIDAGTVARIVQKRAANAGFDPAVVGGQAERPDLAGSGMAALEQAGQ